MKKLLTLLMLLPFAVTAQISESFRDFNIIGNKLLITGVSMNVKDQSTNKVVFDGYKQGSIIISNSNEDPTLATIDINLGGYFKINDGEVYSLEVKYQGNTMSVNYMVKDEITNLLASVLLIYRDSELNTVAVIASTDAKNSKKMLVIKLTGLEIKTERGY